MPKNKKKGSNIERELYQKFVENGYRAVRVAGSGTMENADCDLIAGKKGKKFCIEVKSSKKPVKYISKEQIKKFLSFAEIIGMKPIIALKFSRKEWIFLNCNHLRDCGKNWTITLQEAEKKGKSFEEVFK